jgi:hypothetical protein
MPPRRERTDLMGNTNSLAKKPSLAINLAAEVSPLDQEGRHLVVQSSDKGRSDRRKPPEQWDEDPHLKVR